MKTEIEKLLKQYPDLQYEDGFLYADKDDDGYLHDKGVPLDGKHLISEFYEGREIPENVDEVDPEKMNYIPASGMEYVKYMFNGDFNKALKSI